jgi:regulator of PEP synthase PpsR (kinase-PPPase family)
MKGLPQLADDVYNIYSPNVKAIQSPAIIIALQHRFVNGFSNSRVPKFVYYKAGKVVKEKVTKIKTKKGVVVPVVFDSEIVDIIQSALCYDSKTYDYLKFSPQIQKLGLELEVTLKQKTV